MNETLLICLKEIDDADIFAGMYGRRYGSCYNPADDNTQWVLDSFQRASEDYPWVMDHKERAITEIEFRHGFMNQPGPVCCAFRCHSYLYRESVCECVCVCLCVCLCVSE